jgi:hypothetical protein
MTFLLSEDAALRSWLDGLVVSDQTSEDAGMDRSVGVWFGQPDQEVRYQKFPFITIDMIDISRDPAREMRGKVSPDYLAPDNLDDNKNWEIHLPIPVNIDYQVTIYTRHPRHDRQLLSQILSEKIPFRFGQVDLDDGTVRRLELLGIAKRDNSSEQAKRIFVNVLTVRITSELPEGKLKEAYKVLSVNTSVNTTYNIADNSVSTNIN